MSENKVGPWYAYSDIAILMSQVSSGGRYLILEDRYLSYSTSNFGAEAWHSQNTRCALTSLVHVSRLGLCQSGGSPFSINRACNSLGQHDPVHDDLKFNFISLAPRVSEPGGQQSVSVPEVHCFPSSIKGRHGPLGENITSYMQSPTASGITQQPLGQRAERACARTVRRRAVDQP